MVNSIHLPFGGPDGELGAATRYLQQRYSMPYAQVKGMLTDIGTEELGHIEMISAILYQLTRCLSTKEIKDSGFDAYFVDHTTGIYPQAASGVPFSAGSLQVTGDTIADLTEDLAAEQKARLSYDNILRLIDDPDVRDPIKFLREREIVHFQRFGEALRITQDNLDPRNFYAFNPSYDRKCNPPDIAPVAPAPCNDVAGISNMPCNMPNNHVAGVSDMPCKMPNQNVAGVSDMPCNMPNQNVAGVSDMPCNMPNQNVAGVSDMPCNMPNEDVAGVSDMPCNMSNEDVAGVSDMPCNMSNEAVGGVSKTSAEEDVITAYKSLDISVYDKMENENCNTSNVSGVTDVKPAKKMKSKVSETSKTKPEKESKVSGTSKSKTAGTSKKSEQNMSKAIDWTCKFNQPMYNASNFGYNAVSPYGYNPAKKNKRNPYSHG